jgi:hypothetical protein
MSHVHERHIRPLAIARLAAALGLAIAVVGCGKDSPTAPAGGGGGSTTFVGAAIMAGQVGQVGVSISSTVLAPAGSARAATTLARVAIVPVSGTIDHPSVSPDPVTFSGTYDTATNDLQFAVTSAAGTFSFVGHVDPASPPSIAGSITTPTGAGTWTALGGATTNVASYCGTFTGTLSGAVTFMVREVIITGDPNGRVVGVLFPTGGSRGFPFAGYAVEEEPVNPNQRTLVLDGDQAGDYSIFGSGVLQRNGSTAFSGMFFVTDSLTMQVHIANYSGAACAP